MKEKKDRNLQQQKVAHALPALHDHAHELADLALLYVLAHDAIVVEQLLQEAGGA